MTEHRRRLAEIDVLSNLRYAPSKVAGEMMEFRGQRYSIEEADNFLIKVHCELEEDGRYLARFDQTVFTLYNHLAQQLGREEEFGLRYRFHLELQRLLRLISEQQAQVEGILHILHIRKPMHLEQVLELEAALAQVHERTTEVFVQAGHLLLPPLNRLQADQALASLLPPKPDLPSLRSAESYTDLDLGPLAVFHNELAKVVDRLSRIQVKSLAGILNIQEELFSQWNQHSETAPQHGLKPAGLDQHSAHTRTAPGRDCATSAQHRYL